jgi:SAM-dependent methyltransferase
VTARAERLGLDQRITTRRLEFPDDLESLAPADVIWASMVLHHIGDERSALRQLRRLTRPGGLLALIEHLAPVRVVADDELGRPGLWQRLDAAWTHWFTDMRATLPGSTPSGDYAEALADAGFEVVVVKTLEVSHGAPLDDAARQYARRQIEGARQRLTTYAEADDLAALELLLDDHSPDGIMRRGDAIVRTTRHLYIGRATTS